MCAIINIQKELQTMEGVATIEVNGYLMEKGNLLKRIREKSRQKINAIAREVNSLTRYYRMSLGMGMPDAADRYSEMVLEQIIPSGFVDKLRAAGLDPRSFKLIVGEKEEKIEGDKNQLPIFENMVES